MLEWDSMNQNIGFEMVLANNRVLSIRLGLKNGTIHIKWHCLLGESIAMIVFFSDKPG